MIVVASNNGKVGIKQAMQAMVEGGTAVDAVEIGIRAVESNLQERSVGLGGIPNLLGVVELDASIMHGGTLKSGAVGALRDFEHPISVARKVMEELVHDFLVAEGAARFAAEMGFAKRNLLTLEAREIWQKRLRDQLGVQDLDQLQKRTDLRRLGELATDPQKVKGTVNFIAMDRAGNICTGVSTSGWSWKYPGRLGDSPIIGAGNYCDNRYGGACCVGSGELAIRAGTARGVVLYLKLSYSLEAACAEALKDLRAVQGPPGGGIQIIAIDKQGTPLGGATGPGGKYLYLTDTMTEPAEGMMIHVALN